MEDELKHHHAKKIQKVARGRATRSVAKSGDDLMIVRHQFWNILGSIMRQFEIMFGSIWDQFGIILGSIWDHSGIILRSFWDHFTAIWGHPD